MRLLNLFILSVFCFTPVTLFASDCSVGYAHMQNGKLRLAYKEFRELAERGYPIYMNMMGDMHLKGQGVPANKVMAHAWYRLAAAQDDKEGIIKKAQLAHELSSQQLLKSMRIAKDYLKPYIAHWSLKAD